MDEFRKEATAHATKDNKLAGRRARMASLELTKMFKEYRWVSIEWDKGDK